MINVQKQISYWQIGSDEELLNAQIMIANKRHLAGLFFCHLCIEKILKAIIVKVTEQHPSRTHNLSWLAEKAMVTFDDKQDNLISILQVYQLEGRYPENFPIPPDGARAKSHFEETLNLQQWLKTKL